MNNVKKLRKDNNLTQKEIGEKIGITQQAYQKIEQSGKTTINTLTKLADYYNVSLDYLCNRPFNNNIGYLTPKQKELTIKISKLTDQQIEQVNTIMETLKIVIPEKIITTIKEYKGE